MSKLLYWTAFTLSTLTLSAQAPQKTGKSCDRTSLEWTEHYSKLTHYIPASGDAVVTIHCNLIIWQNDEGTTNFQDTPEQRKRLSNLFHHPVMGMNFQFYDRFNPPTDPIIPANQEVHQKNIRFQLDSIYFFRSTKMTRSIGIGDKRDYLRKNGFKKLLNQVNINITTSPGPMAGAWGHAEYPTYGNRVPMITTTDNPNQQSYKTKPTKEGQGAPVSIATLDDIEYYRDWSFMEHLAHELGHCLDLKHVYAGRVGLGYEACRTKDGDYMDDIFPKNAPWCESPRNGCNVCLQYSDVSIPANLAPDDGHTNNLMNGRGGRYLSPKQLGKIHRSLAMTSIGMAATGFSNTPIVIDSNQVWDFPLQLYCPIRIRKGVSLTVKCTLKMPPQGFIRVDKGGQLIIDGGTVMSSDPKSATNWKAFRVKRLGKRKQFLKVINDGVLELPEVDINKKRPSISERP